VQAMQAAARAA